MLNIYGETLCLHPYRLRGGALDVDDWGAAEETVSPQAVASRICSSPKMGNLKQGGAETLLSSADRHRRELQWGAQSCSSFQSYITEMSVTSLTSVKTGATEHL